MPFPFIPFGAMMAMLVLGATFVLFFVAVNKIDRTIMDVGGAVVGRLVSGFGDWSREQADVHGSDDGWGTERSDGGLAAGDSFEAVDWLETASPVPVEPARVIRR